MSEKIPEQGDLWHFQGQVVLLHKVYPTSNDLHNMILYDGDGDTFCGSINAGALVDQLLDEGTYIGNISALTNVLKEKKNGN